LQKFHYNKPQTNKEGEEKINKKCKVYLGIIERIIYHRSRYFKKSEDQ